MKHLLVFATGLFCFTCIWVVFTYWKQVLTLCLVLGAIQLLYLLGQVVWDIFDWSDV